MIMTTLSRLHATLGLAAGLALAAPLSAAAAPFDTSIQDRPCEALTAQMVADVLDVGADRLEQSQPLDALCSYEMEEDGDTLQVEVTLDARESVDAAAAYFSAATRSMSREELEEAMKTLQDMSAEDESDGQEEVTDGIASGLMQDGIQFEDVEGVGDEARFEPSNGSLHLRKGNLLIDLSAFHGPKMPLPDKITSDTIMKAMNAWLQDTMDTRKKQAVALAGAVLADL